MKFINTISHLFKNDEYKTNAMLTSTDNIFDKSSNMMLDEKLSLIDDLILGLKNNITPIQVTLSTTEENLDITNLLCYVIGRFVIFSGVIKTTGEITAGSHNISFSPNVRPKTAWAYYSNTQNDTNVSYNIRFVINRGDPNMILRNYNTIPNNTFFNLNMIYILDDYPRHLNI